MEAPGGHVRLGFRLIRRNMSGRSLRMCGAFGRTTFGQRTAFVESCRLRPCGSPRGFVSEAQSVIWSRGAQAVTLAKTPRLGRPSTSRRRCPPPSLLLPLPVSLLYTPSRDMRCTCHMRCCTYATCAAHEASSRAKDRARSVAAAASVAKARGLVDTTGLHRDGASALRDPARHVRPCAATPGRCRGRSRAGVLCFPLRLL